MALSRAHMTIPAGGRMAMDQGIDQETAIEELRERYAHGGLPLEEFRQVMGKLMVTSDPVERRAILQSLPAEPAYELPTIAQRSSRPQAQSVAQGRTISAIFGSVDRSGSLWELGPETKVNATFGEVRLDVRMARLAAGENVLRLNALFGEIDVLVPHGLHVLIESNAIFGEVSVPDHSVSGITAHEDFTFGEAQSTSYLRIIATATFGEVSIRAV
ncbi:MAG: LiaF domain-containing protein [Ktedonobacterales bacterium]